MEITPNTFSEHPNASPGERKIFKKLRDSEKGKDWIVLHSLDLLSHVTKSQSEADFVVLIPGVGALVLEVKSAKSISHGTEGWRIGRKVEQRGPFKQANEAMRSIMEYLDEVGLSYHDVPFVHAVWFTEITRAGVHSSIAWQDDQILASEDLAGDIVDVLSKATKRLVSGLKMHKPLQLAPHSKLKQITQVLLPRFTAYQSPIERQKEVKDFLDSALQEQLEMMRLVGGLKSVLLPGMAGTGKTHIALQAARQAHERGEQTLFLCYNNMLAQHIRGILANFPLVRVVSLHALLLEIAGLSVPGDATPDFWERTLINEALKNAVQFVVDNPFDTLIIDEAQDIGTTDYLLVLDALLKHGLSGAKVLACGDFEHQGVYVTGKESLANFVRAIPGLQVLSPLLTNCRNTQTLGDYLVALLRMNPEYDSYRREDSDSQVNSQILKYETEFGSVLSKEFYELTRKFSPEHVVLLSAQKQQLVALAEKSKIEYTELRNPRPGRIRLGSVQEFKGLEAMAVVMVEFDTSNPTVTETFYVGGTRALHDFTYIITESKLNALLQGASNGKPE